jgi:PAS domain S-box-containing protein
MMMRIFELIGVLSTLGIMTLLLHFVARKRRVAEQVQESEARVHSIIESIPLGMHVYQLEPDGRLVFTSANPAADEILGVDSAQFIGKTIEQAFPVLAETEIPEQYRLVALTGKPWHAEQVDYQENQIVGAFEVHAFQTSPGKIAIAFQDVTERKRVEEALRQRNRELALLNAAGQVLGSTLDLDQVFAIVLEEVRRLLEVSACSIWLVAPGSDDPSPSVPGELICRQASGPQSEIVRGWRLPPGVGIAGWVARNGESLIVPDTRADARHFKGVAERMGLELRSILSVPLQVKQRVIGVLQVMDAEVGRFNTEDLALLEPLAASAAIAIENARLYERAQGEIVERKRAEEGQRKALTEALRATRARQESEERFQRLSQAAFEGIVISDKGKILDVNDQFADMIGYESSEIVGIDAVRLVAPESRDLVLEKMMTGHEALYEHTALRKDGSTFPVEAQAKALPYQGRVVRVTAIRDITERLHVEGALRESEKRFRDLFENAPLCIFEMDLTQTPPIILQANRRAEQVYGWWREEFASAPLGMVIPPIAMPELARMVDALREGKALTLESVHQRRNGSGFPVRISAATEVETDLSRIIVAVEDISIEKERRSEEEAIMEERRRIAREIHDGLAQNLAAMHLRVSLWHNLVDNDPVQMHAELDRLQALMAENIRDVRRSIFALRPIALDELGFFPALRQFTDDFGEQNQLDIDLRILGPEGRLPPALELVLFRIVQEALNNVGKHAQARTVWLELDLEAAEAVTLTVRDDGVGFDPALLERAVRHGHLGLRQMRERVASLQGTFLLQSKVGRGTEIRVVLPSLE